MIIKGKEIREGKLKGVRGIFRKVVIAITISLLWPMAALSAAELYVSPKGNANGKGSSDNPLDIVSVLSSGSQTGPGDTIFLLGGTYEGPITREKIEKDGKLKFERTVRGVLSIDISGAKGKPVRIMPALGETVHINGTVAIGGSHIEIIGLEIGDLSWDITKEKHSCDTAVNILGHKQYEEDVKIINCNIFGGAKGSALGARQRM